MNHSVIAIFMVGLGIVLATAGCAKEEEFEFQSGDMLRLGSGRPRVCVKAYPVNGEWAWTRPLTVKEPSVLEFLPLAGGQAREDARMEVYLLDGREVTLLHTCKPLFFQDRDFEKTDRLGVTRHAVRVPLKPGKSETLFLKWTLKEGGRPLKGAVGNPKIYPESVTARSRPDILFICSDTHRFDTAFGEMGARLMPGLQELAGKSTVYQNASSNASWTMPSLASTLTGLFPRYHRSGCRVAEGEIGDDEGTPLGPGQFLFNTGGKRRVFTVYPLQLTTLTERLQARGYVTALVASNPLYQLSGLYADGHDLFLATGVAPGGEVNAPSMEIMARRPKDRPLFMLVHYMDVHQWRPWYFDKDAPGENPMKNRDKVWAAYEKGVRDTDRHLAALLERWDREVGLDQSLVVFYSDHGEHLVDPGREILGHGNTMDEALLRIPLLVHFPRRCGIAPGEESAPVSLVDLAATVLDLVGATPEAGTLHGRSLLNLAGTTADGPRPLFADSQLFGDPLSSVRSGAHKMIIHLETGDCRMLDVTLPLTDAGEPGQVIENEALTKKLREVFETYARTAEKATADLKADHVIDQDQALQDLQALGYAK